MQFIKKIFPALVLVIASLILSCSDGLNGIYENGKIYSVGDTGPAGGIIFYVNPNYEDDGWMYLEAAPADEADSPWGATNPVSGADSLLVGSGKQNTSDIVKSGPVGVRAADRCYLKWSGGYNDWFLPSRDELVLIYEELRVKAIGNISPVIYWSSSEITGSSACSIDMNNNGGIATDGKNSNRRVRAVRRF